MKISKPIGQASGVESNSTRLEQLLKAVEISAGVIRESSSLSPAQKQIALGGLEQMRSLAAATPPSRASKGLKDIEQAVVQPWNEESGEDAKKFWRAAAKAGLLYTPRDVLRDVLKRQRIKDRLDYEVVIDTVDGDEESGKITAAEASDLRKLAAAFERQS